MRVLPFKDGCFCRLGCVALQGGTRRERGEAKRGVGNARARKVFTRSSILFVLAPARGTAGTYSGEAQMEHRTGWLRPACRRAELYRVCTRYTLVEA